MREIIKIGDTVIFNRVPFNVFKVSADKVALGFTDNTGIIHVRWVPKNELLKQLVAKAA